MAGKYGDDVIIIETKCPFFTCVDLKKDEQYGKFVEAELAGTLPEPKNCSALPRAAYYHKKGMMYEVVEYDDGDEEVVVKESVLACEPADARGRLFINVKQKELAARILNTLKKIDKSVTVDPSSAMTEEELLGPIRDKEKNKNKGGRPRKIKSRRPAN